MNTDLTARDVYAYNLDGKRHRATVDVITAIDKARDKANAHAIELFTISIETDYEDLEHEIDRHQAEGYAKALADVLQYLRSKSDSL